MFDVAKVLSLTMRTALAAHFENLNPKPVGGTPRELVRDGKKIYEEGVPDSNVQPCASCHGADAKGGAGGPRLAGQLRDYTFKTLMRWSNERSQNPAKPDASAAIMEPIARSLTETQISGVAAYLGEVE